jgi:hypothetical protein
MTVSSSVTSVDLAGELARLSDATASPERRSVLDDLKHAIGVLTSARYAASTAVDRGALDAALARGAAAVATLARDFGWPRRLFRQGVRPRQPVERPA